MHHIVLNLHRGRGNIQQICWFACFSEEHAPLSVGQLMERASALTTRPAMNKLLAAMVTKRVVHNDRVAADYNQISQKVVEFAKTLWIYFLSVFEKFWSVCEGRHGTSQREILKEMRTILMWIFASRNQKKKVFLSHSTMRLFLLFEVTPT